MAIYFQVARYIINETREHFQCIVISLKEEFYTRAEVLIGITAEVSTCLFQQCLCFGAGLDFMSGCFHKVEIKLY